jgi:hypothetical protein
MIDGHRILTNAHAVEYGSLIQVKKRQSERKYVSSVVAIAHECECEENPSSGVLFPSVCIVYAFFIIRFLLNT